MYVAHTYSEASVLCVHNSSPWILLLLLFFYLVILPGGHSSAVLGELPHSFLQLHSILLCGPAQFIQPVPSW